MKRLRVKARTGAGVHVFHEFLDEEWNAWLMSPCGLRLQPAAIELVDPWTPTTCPACAADDLAPPEAREP